MVCFWVYHRQQVAGSNPAGVTATMSKAYYNEFDPGAAQWLRNLIAAGLIAPGDVDERSIEDVTPADLEGYTQCHWFAGIGIWSAALRDAGWPDDRACWSGSPPCQSFSNAGKGRGFADERHLWPAYFHLIQHGKPEGVPVFGEQVASGSGLQWLDLVSADLEAAGHAVWPYDLSASGVGAPHIRQRLYFAATPTSTLAYGGRDESGRRYAVRGAGGEEIGAWKEVRLRTSTHPADGGAGLGVADTTNGDRWSGERGEEAGIGANKFGRRGSAGGGTRSRPGETNGFWGDADWIFCKDNKWRPVKPGTSPLANGADGRMAIVLPGFEGEEGTHEYHRLTALKGIGNAIVRPLAAAFIRAYMETIDACAARA